MVDYKPNIDCEPEGSDSIIKPVNHEKEEVKHDAMYAEMELPCQGNMHQG